LQTETAENHLKGIEKEKQEVQDLMKKLESMDKSSIEFTDWILYGLLPQYKTKNAKRLSTFPSFMNIRKFFKNYNYTEEDWNKIANMIYNLSHDFQKSPNELKQHIKKFTSDKRLCRNLQTGSITPILFCINDNFPVINNRVRYTYEDFSLTEGWNDKISQKIDDYPDGIEKCQKLINFLNIDEVKNFSVFDLFCYWYDYLKKKEEPEEIPEEEGGEKTDIKDVNFEEFVQSANLEDLKQFDPHSLANPELIKIKDLVNYCEKGKWQLPYFQRYFDWTAGNIRDLLESIFKDFYIGSLLVWEKREPQIRLQPIEGVKLKDPEERPDFIILDGQQRITSLYIAIKSPKEFYKNIKTPAYFYIDFEKFLNRIEGDFIIRTNQKLSREDSIKKMHFPFYELENFRDWADAFEDYYELKSPENHTKIKQMKRTIERRLSHIIEGFQIPYVKLPETLDLDSVTNIFELINTTGKVLSVFDILRAKFSLHEIDLKILWQKTYRQYPKLKEYNARDKTPIYILQAISLYHHPTSACKRSDLLNIHRNVIEPKDLSFEDVWDDMALYVDKAISRIENLRGGYGVQGKKMPSTSIIPILTALLYDIDSRDNKNECYEKIRSLVLVISIFKCIFWSSRI